MSLLKHRFVLRDLGPLSVNATYVRTFTGTHKSSLANEWTAQAVNQLSAEHHQAALQELRNFIKPKEHYIKFNITVVYPRKLLITKAGGISSKSQDCSNFEKSIIDLMMLPKFHIEEFPYGGPNCNIDDKIIAHMESRKAASSDGESRGLVIEIEVHPLDALPTIDLGA